MFQPVFQAGMLASSAGSCPAPALSKWVREGAAVEAAGVLAKDLHEFEQTAGS